MATPTSLSKSGLPNWQNSSCANTGRPVNVSLCRNLHAPKRKFSHPKGSNGAKQTNYCGKPGRAQTQKSLLHTSAGQKHLLQANAQA